MRHKFFLYFATLLINLMLVSSSAKANTESNHTVIYNISSNLNTDVNHIIELTHSDKYNGINKLTFEEPVDNITNLKKLGKDSSYTIINLKNKVEIEFNNILLGPIAKKIEYSYSSNSIIKKVGTTYLLEVPKINGNLINEYQLKIYIPDTITTLNYSQKLKSDKNGNFLLFNKEDLQNYGKYINFGDYIFYELSVKHLISSEKNYIIIPPTIPQRQTVYVKSISKNPKKIYRDYDNNTIFEYETTNSLEGITAIYLIKVFGNASKQQVSNLEEYTKPIKNWDYTGDFVNNLLLKIKGKPTSLEDAYFETITNLDYNNTSTNYNYKLRVGAENLNETNSKKAVCLEYSDLLISLLRGVGVPAREINGYTYKNDINVYQNPPLHSWVDYYTNGYWIQADPTWSDTSEEDYFYGFDLFHIAFLIKSRNSEFPLLTGSYSKNNITEQIKIVAINTPTKRKVNLKVVDLYFVKYVINDSFEYLQNIHPMSAKLLSNKEFEDIKHINNDFYTIIGQSATYKDFFRFNANILGLLVIILLISCVMFILIHLKLKKAGYSTKQKISRIV